MKAKMILNPFLESTFILFFCNYFGRVQNRTIEQKELRQYQGKESKA